ncbi:DegT/DnrJ/EryC1/StrS family aminotransferase [Silvimonas iriomotensis]|uniref:Aminotransferase n=1 Tax=Silvimonas iriomotensis TaxID=449662 RepID=A0ABQ2P559_9NEIS|nr:DegT/DnrJ/EryC1/StrS family aminotransferase [Silvimonas iriomotensis]GGP18594.1 aminotransferase [Silvimonas iriomotensis]
MSIPFLDLRAINGRMHDEIQAAISRVLEAGWYIHGKEVTAFEQQFATWCGGGEVVGVGNGLDALVLALRAAGIGPGDEVIVPAHTFIATWLAVSAVGATPVAVDVHVDTYNLDASLIEAALTARTRAILVVHLYGQLADMDAICALAQTHTIAVIEDAAQAHGAELHGKPAGAWGLAGCFSFYPGKNLGALGDAGAVVTRDAGLARQIRLLGNYGSQKRYEHEVLGTNSRLDEMQAAILQVRLAHLAAHNAQRSELAARYLTRLAAVPQLGLPAVRDGMKPVWHLFVVRTTARAALQAWLQQHEVQTLVHYPCPPHLQPAYQGRIAPGAPVPVTEQLADQVLSLPMGPHLSLSQIDRVCDLIIQFFAGQS